MKLLLENWRKHIKEISMGHDMTNSIEYTALVLDGDSHDRLAVLAPNGWKAIAHHMTIIRPHEMKSGRLPSQWLEYKGCLKVVAIAQNDQVMAALVDLGGLPMPMKGPTMPHVTIATAVDLEKTKDPKKPIYYSAKLSNEFLETDFQPIKPEPIKICGAVEEVMK